MGYRLSGAANPLMSVHVASHFVKLTSYKLYLPGSLFIPGPPELRSDGFARRQHRTAGSSSDSTVGTLGLPIRLWFGYRLRNQANIEFRAGDAWQIAGIVAG